jgi:excisionase family DNA binding protein
MEFFTVKELAEHLHAHQGTIYKLSRQGRLPGCFRVGAKWLFNRTAIEQWEHTQAPADKRQ